MDHGLFAHKAAAHLSKIPLLEAISEGNLDKVKEIVATDKNLHVQDSNKNTIIDAIAASHSTKKTKAGAESIAEYFRLNINDITKLCIEKARLLFEKQTLENKISELEGQIDHYKSTLGDLASSGGSSTDQAETFMMRETYRNYIISNTKEIDRISLNRGTLEEKINNIRKEITETIDKVQKHLHPVAEEGAAAASAGAGHGKATT